MIFIPMYLAVNIKYGPEVAKELTPLWICGPLLVALYIKILHGLCLLYIYSFKQSVKVVKDLPVYYDYVIHEKLKEAINGSLWWSLGKAYGKNFKNGQWISIWTTLNPYGLIIAN
ncbi:unnamed protein product [Lactuca virosa]|uniref:Uncharacterized protein n=1 Tax=Lactuca virosa TaxID=75947 RepID=A0AAU9MAE5_9ASTR|nr:unnamed protein product [Lactuca virosa]